MNARTINFIVLLAAIFAVNTARASTLDLTTGIANGSVTLNQNDASLTATSYVSFNVVDLVSFDWFFKASDYMPYNDWAYVNFGAGDILLSNIAAVGNYGNSGWHTYAFSEFTGTIKLGVSNAIDQANSSQLFLKNFELEPEGNVPEPSSIALFAAGILGFALSRRKAEQA